MKRFFNVAGHTFAVSMSDDSPIWSMMDNYSPFITEEPVSELFSLSTVSCLPERELTPVLLQENVNADDEAASLNLYRTACGYRVSMAPNRLSDICGWLDMSENLTQGHLQILSKDPSGAKFAFDNSLMLLFAFSTSTKRTLEMHSSTVVYNGMAFMFLGKSGTGKSTHSRLWMENIPGTWLLNDDNPVIRIREDGTAMVYGTPWSGKTPCYRNRHAPIAAIVMLEQAPYNRIQRLRVPEAYAAIYSSASGFHADTAMADGLFETMSAAVTGIPFYRLECLPNAEAAVLCRDTACDNHSNECNALPTGK
ncbi:MAG: hypothetical protein MJY66_03690 [Bacteroidaceae bacterium]|nr:hypothetical protein [Bacteroidaceae bacterium]